MKKFRKLLPIVLSLCLITMLILTVSAGQSEKVLSTPPAEEVALEAAEEAAPAAKPGIHSLEDYLDVTTPEKAAELAANQNVELDLAMYIHKHLDQLIQEYMHAHVVTSDEEAGVIIDALRAEAVQMAKESGLFPAELFIPNRTDLEDIPPVPDGLKGEDLRQAILQQKEMYFLYLRDEELERRSELGLDTSDLAIRDFVDQACELAYNYAEISADSRTIAIAAPAAKMTEVVPVLNRLQAKAKSLGLSLTVSCLDEEAAAK